MPTLSSVNTPASLFQMLSLHETLLQPQLQGHFKSNVQQLERLAPQDNAHHRALRTWLKVVRQEPLDAQEVADLSPVQAASWQGWRSYFEGDYPRAWHCFVQGWEALQAAPDSAESLDTALQVSVALGFGKVYTRTGHWHTARNWLLYALAQAREGDRLYDCVRCYGALGELLLRAGHARPAFFCMGSAYHLLPPGAGERPRQWNYLASALMRLGNERDQQAAQSLLMRSYYLALDSADRVSACHALARLQFLELDRQTNQDVVVNLSAQTLMEEIGCLQQPVYAVPKGFLAIGRTFAAWRGKDTAAAQIHAEQACQYLVKNQAEYGWAQALCHSLGAQSGVVAGSLKTTANEPALAITPAPEVVTIVDRLWQDVPLQDAGATHFTPPQGTPAALLGYRQVFFL